MFPLSFSDISLWLAYSSVILLVASELFDYIPVFSGRVDIDKKLFRNIAIGTGLAFLVTVIMGLIGFF